LVLTALVFSHRLFHPRDAILAAVALVAFWALSSFAYVLNEPAADFCSILSVECIEPVPLHFRRPLNRFGASAINSTFGNGPLRAFFDTSVLISVFMRL
jgi:hypothetical protein